MRGYGGENERTVRIGGVEKVVRMLASNLRLSGWVAERATRSRALFAPGEERRAMFGAGLGTLFRYGLVGLVVIALIVFIFIALTVERTKGLTRGDDQR